MTQTHNLLRRHAFSFHASMGISQLREAPRRPEKNGSGLPSTYSRILTKSGAPDYKRLET
jgi:hypothetical protein